MGERDVKGLPGLGSCFLGAGSWGAAGQTEDTARSWQGCARRGMGTGDPSLAGELGPGFALVCPSGCGASLWLRMDEEGWLRPQLGDARQKGDRRPRLRGG